MTTDSKLNPLPPDDPAFLLEDSPLYNLNRTSATYIDEMSKILGTVDMDQSRWRILMLLADKNPSTVSELSRLSMTKLSTITRILIRMERDGLVTRHQSAHDNRVTEVYATDAAMEKVQGLRAVAGRIYRRAFDNIPTDDIVMFVRILKKMRDNLKKSPYMD